MRFLFASDSFKGTLSSARTAALLTQAARDVFGDIECMSVPVADGGEGTAEAVLLAEGGAWVEARVRGPLMEPVTARYGRLDARRAVIEMAAASGLPLVPADRRDPLYTTTYGTGQLIRHALDQGFTDLSIAIGGSATNDGGMGCARALGIRFLDADGRALEGRGIDLESVHAIDLSGLDPRLSRAKLTVMCDVTNPLCGERGATLTFAAQKGATPEIQRRLEAGMVNYRDVIRRQFNIDPDAIPGAGAAGGLGAALTALLGGTMR
ncbi:MAG: glycerate kinase, partial [Clostridia bacterium]|nr:glycerate kinase [Clostridia bacterium]